MILSVELLMSIPEFRDQDEFLISKRLDAVELLIRKYTNNNFQNRNIRFLASSEGEVLNGVSPFLKVGDTIQITESGVNDGLYTVIELGVDSVTVDRPLFAVDHNLVTKVEYPVDIQVGVINLMRWEIGNRNKVGIKSETLSRHSVTYYDQDASNQAMGYPVTLLGFLEPYKKARF